MDTKPDGSRPVALTKQKRGAGRPPFEPTDQQRELVKECAGRGCSHDTICDVMESELDVQISDVTLRKYFATELRTGASLMNAKLQDAMCRIALDGNFPALKFLLATRLKIMEPVAPPPEPPPPPAPVRFTLQMVGADGQPVDAPSLDHLLDGHSPLPKPAGGA